MNTIKYISVKFMFAQFVCPYQLKTIGFVNCLPQVVLPKRHFFAFFAIISQIVK